MPITFDCDCGKALRVKDEFAGKRVRCPACQAVVTAPEAEIEVATPLGDDTPPPAPATLRTARPARVEDDEPRPAKGKAAKADEEYELDEDEKPAKKPAPKWKRNTHDEEDDDRPRKKMKKGEKKDQKAEHFGIEKKIFRGGVLGGCAAMLVAVVWFVVGLMNDTIFFYPPILFIIGLVAAIKGLVGGDEKED
jgi:hypothetical protein